MKSVRLEKSVSSGRGFSGKCSRIQTTLVFSFRWTWMWEWRLLWSAHVFSSWVQYLIHSKLSSSACIDSILAHSFTGMWLMRYMFPSGTVWFSSLAVGNFPYIPLNVPLLHLVANVKWSHASTHHTCKRTDVQLVFIVTLVLNLSFHARFGSDIPCHYFSISLNVFCISINIIFFFFLTGFHVLRD